LEDLIERGRLINSEISECGEVLEKFSREFKTLQKISSRPSIGREESTLGSQLQECQILLDELETISDRLVNLELDWSKMAEAHKNLPLLSQAKTAREDLQRAEKQLGKQKVQLEHRRTGIEEMRVKLGQLDG